MRYSLLVVLVLAGCSRYDYIERNGATLRVDKLSGKIQAMQRSTNGGIVWSAVKTAADVDEERARCTIRRLPSVEEVRVRVSRDGTKALLVQNSSRWIVTVVGIQFDGRETATTRLWVDGHDGPPELYPGMESGFTLTPRYNLEPTLVVVGVYGKPGDCQG